MKTILIKQVTQSQKDEQRSSTLMGISSTKRSREIYFNEKENFAIVKFASYCDDSFLKFKTLSEAIIECRSPKLRPYSRAIVDKDGHVYMSDGMPVEKIQFDS